MNSGTATGGVTLQPATFDPHAVPCCFSCFTVPHICQLHSNSKVYKEAPCSRYHKEQKAWFQRAEAPSERTQTYERGDYIYFDSTLSESDDSWVFRLKKDFKVDYSQVEGDGWCEDYSVIGMA